ncbi:MAG: hypothetical protein ACREP8_03715, partial [Candidatus Binatia bacterium]
RQDAKRAKVLSASFLSELCVFARVVEFFAADGRDHDAKVQISLTRFPILDSPLQSKIANPKFKAT